ncbi:MAG: peptidoglycan DD-metalloendopeptidase family protein [Vicinamibacterales bacterium]
MSDGLTVTAAPAVGREDSGREAQRAQLLAAVAEFEGMLLSQMLKSMRDAGSWEDGEAEGEGGLKADALFETIDAELAATLSKGRGLGLSGQLLDAFERLADAANSPAAAPTVAPAGPPVGPAGTGRGDDAGARQARLPTPGVRGEADVTSPFGWRRDPFTGTARFHRGVDLRAAYGEPVAAAAAGHVAFAGQQGGYGTTVVVEHADGTRARYAHLSATLVREGSPVAAGDLLGRAGRSGRATGPHLHFEVTTADGQPLDPAGWATPTAGD